MGNKRDNDSDELKELVFKSNCLVKGKPYQRGEVVPFNPEEDEVIINDLKAANRICKTEAEGERAKKSLVEAKKAEEKEDKGANKQTS